MKLNRKNPLLLAAISFTLAAPSAFATSGDWISNTSDNWSVATKWSSDPTVPGTLAGDIIGLTNDISAGRTVTIDTTSRTAGILNIGDSNNTHGFTLAASGGASLTLDNSGSGAQINQTGGIATTISAPVTLADNLAVNSTGYLLVSGGIGETGAKSLTKTGAGTLSLAGTSSYTGGSTVSAGALSFRTTAGVSLTGTHAFGANATLGLGVGAGGFLMTDVNNALGGIVPALGTITLDPATQIGVDTGAGNFNFNTVLATSSRGLVKLGGSTLTLSTDNSAFTGGITVDAGTLAITDNNSLGSTTGKTTINGSNNTGGSALSFGGVASDLTIAEDINFAGNATGRSLLSHASIYNHTLTGAIDLSSDTNIVQWGSGGAAVTGSVKFTGDISGTFTNGAGLLIRGEPPTAPLVNPTNKIESNITLTGGGLTKSDNGTWQIGASGKTYKAPTLGVSNGFLLMGADNYLDTVTPVLLNMGAVSGGTTGDLDLNGFSQTVAGINLLGTSGDKTITSSSGTPVLTVDNATDYTTGSLVALTGSLGLTKKGIGTQTLAATNTYTGNTTISGGTLQIGNGNTTGALTGTTGITNDGILIINRSNAFTQLTDLNGQAITGNGSFTQAGTGTTTLSAINTYTGGTTVTGGRLQPTLATALAQYTSPGKVVFSGGTIVTVMGDGSSTGWSMLQVDSLLASATKTSGALGVDTTNGDLTLATTNLDLGIGLTKLGTNTLTLDQAHTYTGQTTISSGTLRLANTGAVQNSSGLRLDGGTLQLGTDTTISSSQQITMAANNVTVTSDRATMGSGLTHAFGNLLATHNTLNFTAGTNVNVAGTAAIQFASMTCGSGSGGTATLNPTTANLIITGNATGTNTGTSTFSLGGTSQGNSIGGVIENGTRTTQNVTKSNSSIWTLSGANTYTGTTNITGGTLIVNGDQSLATGAVTVSANATLGGTGIIGGNTTIADTGKLAFNLSTVPGSHDKLELASGKTLTFTASSTLTITSSGGATTGLYTLVTAPGGITWTTPPTVILPVGWTYSTITGNGGNDLVINVTSTGSSPYSTWAGTAAFTDDANGDGVKNGLAWLLGAGTPAANALGFLPTVGTPTGFLTLDFKRVNPYAPAKLYVEYGNNLVGWTKLEIPAGAGTIGGDIQVLVTSPGSPTPDEVQVKIPTTHASGGKLFARLSATEN